jgi:hypothetical protein
MLSAMKRIIVPLLVFASPAFAQGPSPAAAPAPQSSPMEQTMANKLLLEIQGGLQCSATLLTVGRQLEVATAQIEDLKRQLVAAIAVRNQTGHGVTPPPQPPPTAVK